METIKGRLEYIRYKGDDHWTAAVLRINHNEIKITGNLIDAELGDSLELTGDWTTHSAYGRQFKFHSYKILTPVTAEGVIGFLESRLQNIGRARAIEMVNYFGVKNIFDVILNEPNRLTKISGITPDRAHQIHLEYKESKNLRDVIVFLKQFRLTDSQVAKIIEEYGSNARQAVEENPYQLIADINGFGFKTVDEFALRMGIDRDGLERAKAGCLYILRVMQNEGNTYLPRDKYREMVIAELNTSTCLDAAIDELRENGHIVVKIYTSIETDRIYDARLYNLECSIASMLIALVEN